MEFRIDIRIFHLFLGFILGLIVYHFVYLPNCRMFHTYYDHARVWVVDKYDYINHKYYGRQPPDHVETQG